MVKARARIICEWGVWSQESGGQKLELRSWRSVVGTEN
jgi:hypothetical protein